MLCDDATINDLNPYVVRDFSLPGGIRQIPDFANHTKDVVRDTSEIAREKLSPICDIASTSGDRTVDFCTGGREPPCPLKRPLEPRRNIDYGWTRNGEGKKVEQSRDMTMAMARTCNMNFIGFMILLTVVVGSFLRR